MTSTMFAKIVILTMIASFGATALATPMIVRQDHPSDEDLLLSCPGAGGKLYMLR
jgi:hypothetical protein